MNDELFPTDSEDDTDTVLMETFLESQMMTTSDLRL